MKWTRKKLKPELEKWVEAELLPATSAEKILERYPEEGANYWMIAFAVIGSVLCLGGVILIISHNWASIAPLTKMMVLLGLQVAVMAVGIESKTRDWHRAWWECSFLAASVFPLLGLMLISQIFHLEMNESFLVGMWLVMIAPIALLTQSISSLVVSLLAQMSLLICLVDGEYIYSGRDEFLALCEIMLMWGIVTAVSAQLWARVRLMAQASVTEFWGILVGCVAVYGYGLEEKQWEAVWVMLFLACLGLIYFGYARSKVHQVNVGFVMIALVILSIFIRLIGDMLDTGLVFLLGGMVMLVGVWGLNRFRKQILAGIDTHEEMKS